METTSPTPPAPSRTRLLDAALHVIRTKGYTATQFVPNGVCNRAQIATFIFRSMN